MKRERTRWCALVVRGQKSPGSSAPPHAAEEIACEESFFLHRSVNQLFLRGEISASREAIDLLIQCSMLEFEIAHAPVRHRIHSFSSSFGLLRSHSLVLATRPQTRGLVLSVNA